MISCAGRLGSGLKRDDRHTLRATAAVVLIRKKGEVSTIVQVRAREESVSSLKLCESLKTYGGSRFKATKRGDRTNGCLLHARVEVVGGPYPDLRHAYKRTNLTKHGL